MSLFQACQKANSEQVKLLINQQCNIAKLDQQGRTALHYCFDHSTIDCACLILQLAKEKATKDILNIQDNEGCSVLHLACLNGNAIMVEYFCEEGADVRLLDKESHSLIHWITVCGHLHLFDLLIRYKTPVHTADIHGAFPVHYASQLCGVDINGESNISPVKGLAILRKLIDYKVEIDCIDGQKRTPFIWAASAGALNALRVLHEKGANALHIDKDSLTALHCAATHGHASCIRMLVEQCQCPLEGEDINGCTALFYAVTLNHRAACQTLLDLKANPDHQDNRGRTPSHCAALKGNVDCLIRLLKSNANIWIKNKRGDYPIHEAINATPLCMLRNQTAELPQLQAGCFAVIRHICRQYPNKVNIPNGEHRTPLHLAASLGDIDMCGVLIECSARVNSFLQTLAGNFLTPYDLARIRRQDACADFLVHSHAGQRGNLLAHILARRIQRWFRQRKNKSTRKQSIEAVHRRQMFAITTHTTEIKISSSTESQQVETKRKMSEQLLTQAKVCLDNKKTKDHQRTPIPTMDFLSQPQPIMTSSPKNDENSVECRRRSFAKSKSTITTINNSHESNFQQSPDKVIVHPSNSISTSVKLYERHKLIAEELYKLKQARINNLCVVINQSLYKILIENAFNPQHRRVEEIERYLETLLKAYANELEAIRKRTKSVPAKRNHHSISRLTRQDSIFFLARKNSDPHLQ